MIVRTTTITNKLGLHARAASKLVQVAQTYRSEISIHNNMHTANGKSIMSIMMLQAAIGTDIEIRVEGEDEQDALHAIIALIEDRFGEGE